MGGEGGAAERSARRALLVAATHSGAGKTTATSVLIRALRQRGLSVQAFKIGPDFIDAAYHAEATGRPSINLDVWMMGEEGVRRSFRRWSREADVSVIESMGALYDGADGTDRGSAGSVAKLLDVPVVIVLDVWGMTRTAAAILQGLRAFDPEVPIAGCLLNRVGSAAHAELVVSAMDPGLRETVHGWIERLPELEVAERHLGLTTVEENVRPAAVRATIQTAAAEHIDVERLLAAVTTERDAQKQRTSHATPRGRTAPARARLAIARDEAFCFYYEENLIALRDVGFELVPFRPTVDARLPAGADAIYIGGGYPESFAARLAANRTLAAELRERADDGTPIYAECGGLVYLGRSLVGFDGARHAMAGVLPIDFAMDAKHLSIRYVEVRTRRRTVLGEPGVAARGQEFHQSRIERSEIEPSLFDVTTSDGASDTDGFGTANVVASYVHLHFSSNPELASALLRAATRPHRRP